MIFHKNVKQTQWRKEVFSAKGDGAPEQPNGKKRKTYNLTPYTKVNHWANDQQQKLQSSRKVTAFSKSTTRSIGNSNLQER